MKPKGSGFFNPNLAAFAVGLALFGFGLGAVYWPLAPLGVGVVLMAVAVFGRQA